MEQEKITWRCVHGNYLRRISAEDANAGSAVISPSGIAEKPEIDRIVTTNATHGWLPTAKTMIPRESVQVWRLNDKKLLRTIPFVTGPRGKENIAPYEPRFVHSPKSETVLINSVLGGALYVSTNIAASDPVFRLVYDFGANAIPAYPMITQNDRYYLQPLTDANKLVVLDIGDPLQPQQVAEARFDRNPDNPGEKHDGQPHFLVVDRDDRRLAVSDYVLDIPSLLADGDRRIYLLKFDPVTGALEFDRSFRHEFTHNIGIEFNRDVWPHGKTGPAHVGHQMWERLGLDAILSRAGLTEDACALSEAMTLKRLIAPSSESRRAGPDWIRRTALGDILKEDFSELEDESLYRNLDRLHPNRELIERELAEQEKTLFNLDDTVYLYDLTSTYFEGQAKRNPQAKRGYSRDKRPDCKQVVVGLAVDRNGFPKAHEVFDGNVQDRSTVAPMLDLLEQRVGKKPGSTVIVDRGMAYKENLKQIRGRDYHDIVAGRQPERNEWLDELEKEEGWEEVMRIPSPLNPFQKKTRVQVKRQQRGDELFILCSSEGRQDKDRAIREKQEQKLLQDMERLKRRVEKGQLKKAEKIHQAIGRLKERYPRVARYYGIEYDVDCKIVTWREDADKKAIAKKLDGSYVLKTDRKDLTAEEIWRNYILLTRVEDAFRDMKSPLMERPIFHHLKHRTQTHIFLCVLAYQLLAVIEQYFLEAGIHTSWGTLREELGTHQVVTVVLPAETGAVLRIRKGSTPEAGPRQIYQTLQIPLELMKPVKSWTQAA